MSRRAVPQRTWIVAFGLVALATISLSIASYAGFVPGILPDTQLDKVIHFAVGACLAATLDGALGRRCIWIVPYAAPVVLIPAGIEEFLQRFSSTRTSSFADFAADTLGVVVGIWLARRALS